MRLSLNGRRLSIEVDNIGNKLCYECNQLIRVGESKIQITHPKRYVICRRCGIKMIELTCMDLIKVCADLVKEEINGYANRSDDFAVHQKIRKGASKG